MLCMLALGGCGKEHIAGRKPDCIIGEQGLGPGQFVYPRGIAAGPDGCIFVVDKTARIQRFSPEGEYQTGWRMPEWQAGKPTGLTVDKAGRVLVADTHYHRVIIFDRDGHELTRFGSEGTGPGQFGLPTQVAVDREGDIYVGEYGGNDRISRFSPQLEYKGSMGGPDAGPAALLRPQALAFDAEDTLWVADSCHHRVCRFSREGKLLAQFGGAGHEGGQVQYPYGVALCGDGTVLVCEFGGNRLQRFDRTGRSLELWGTPGREPGQLAYPWGVAVGAAGRVYVVDAGNNRVQMFGM
jgi:DNA-binding beta-propeller fold protein YncE